MLSVLLNGTSGEVYNIGDANSEVNLIEIADLAHQAADRPGYSRFDEDSPMIKDAPTRRKPDMTKIMRIAPPPEIGLADGLKRTYDYYRSDFP